jgi:hypothetical protein
MASSMDWVAVNRSMLARLLYPNPVCLLSVLGSDGNSRSLMTITWLTAINNNVRSLDPVGCKLSPSDVRRFATCCAFDREASSAP